MPNPYTQRVLNAEAAFQRLCDDPDALPAAVNAAFEALCEAETDEQNYTKQQVAGRWHTVSAVEAILARIDPVNILTPHNPDEYDAIAEVLTVHLDECHSPAQLTDLTRRVFARWFWDPAPGDPANYVIIGHLLWRKLLQGTW